MGVSDAPLQRLRRTIMQPESRKAVRTMFVALATVLVLVGCGRSEKVASVEPNDSERAEVGQPPVPDEASERERELAAREAAVSAREAELDSRAPRSTQPVPPASLPPAPPTATMVPPTPTAVPPTPTPAPISVTVPAGSLVTVEILDTLSSHESATGQQFTARVVEPVKVPQGIAIPAGSIVTGKVTEAKPAKKIGGSSRLAVEFVSLRLPSGETAPFQAAFSTKGKSSTGRDVGIIAGAAAGGAILGNQVIDDDGGTKGALIGAAAGAIAASQTKAKPVVIEAGTVTNLDLTAPIDLKIRPSR
jgi:hypothetical protein